MRIRNKSFIKLGCHAFIMIIGQFLSENCSIRLKFPNLPISGRNTIFEGYNNVL